MIAVVVLTLAGIGLVGWLVLVLGRFALEPRFPRPSSMIRLARGEAARRRRDREDEQREPDDQPSVELAVRERLYGSRLRPR